MLNIFKRIKRAIRTRQANKSYTKAVKMADNAFKTTGKRHFVIMLDSGRLAIYSRETFRKHRLKGYNPAFKNCNMTDLVRSCVYRTPTLGNNNPLTAEEANVRKSQYVSSYISM